MVLFVKNSSQITTESCFSKRLVILKKILFYGLGKKLFVGHTLIRKIIFIEITGQREKLQGFCFGKLWVV